jgi:hypothetical protein
VIPERKRTADYFIPEPDERPLQDWQHEYEAWAEEQDKQDQDYRETYE